MLALIFDVGGGYLVAQYIRSVWLSIIAAVFVGIVSSISANLLLYAIASDVVSPDETIAKMLGGLMWHPIVTVVAAFAYRRKLSKKLTPEPEVQKSNG